MNRKGLTLIELLIVVACSIGILVACEGAGPSPGDPIVVSMRSDLQRLV
jgi:Tfp pilus assembly protein PilE